MQQSERINQLASDTYLSLDTLLKAIEQEDDTPPEIVIEGESLMETFQGFLETIQTG